MTVGGFYSDGGLRVLVVRRREGGREGEVVLRVWVNAVATEGLRVAKGPVFLISPDISVEF